MWDFWWASENDSDKKQIKKTYKKHSSSPFWLLCWSPLCLRQQTQMIFSVPWKTLSLWTPSPSRTTCLPDWSSYCKREPSHSSCRRRLEIKCRRVESSSWSLQVSGLPVDAVSVDCENLPERRSTTLQTPWLSRRNNIQSSRGMYRWWEEQTALN